MDIGVDQILTKWVRSKVSMIELKNKKMRMEANALKEKLQLWPSPTPNTLRFKKE